MLKGVFVAVLAAALLVTGLGILVYVNIARDRLLPTPTSRPTAPPPPTLTRVPSPVPMPTATPEPLAAVVGRVREYSPGALIIVLTPLEGSVEQVIVPENTVVLRSTGERASLREIVPGAQIRAEGALDALGRMVAERVTIDVMTIPTTPTAAPVRSPTPPQATPIVRRAWYGEYFGNQALEGPPAFTREDQTIDFTWGQGGPSGLPNDHFSVRWRGRWPFAQGVYRFNTYSDDGVRLWVDDKLVIDRWVDQAATLASVELPMTAGDHDVRVEYYEAADQAQIRVWWEEAEHFTGWHGEYFGNPDLTGMPGLERSDPEIVFDWGRGSPAPNIPVDGFSARWTRALELPRGAYRLQVRADDGVRVWIDDRLFIDEWHDSKPKTYLSHVWFTGEAHEVRVEYYEAAGDANIRLWWEKVETFKGWRGEYYDNPELGGPPVFLRDDESIDFNWEHGSPQVGFPVDNFSVRWRKTVNLPEGLYRFWAEADDGVRLYVGSQRLIDHWVDSPAERKEGIIRLPAGDHTIAIEYYERGDLASIRVGWERIEGVTATPSPTVTSSPTATSTPEPTATLSGVPATATATQTLQPSHTPSPTHTSTSTEMPQPPTDTPAPSDIPTVTHTVEPSDTPAPTDTPAPPSETATPAPGITAAPEPG